MCVVILISVFLSVQGTDGLLAPSYISDWIWMDANNASTTFVTFSHNFGVRPVKHEVQVKSPDTGFIYPGVGSAHNDNDHGYRGGVICLYNEYVVRLFGVTNYGSSHTNGYIIYTGHTSWKTDNGEMLHAAYVRVRLWHPDDLPAPSYQISLTMAAQRTAGYSNYEELPHNQASLPALTVVQYYSTSTSSDLGGVVAEAQGTNQLQTSHAGGYPNVRHEASFVFGVNDSHIRLWAASNVIGEDFYIFSFCDGWGYYTTYTSYCAYSIAYVNISFWYDLETTSLHTGTSHHTVSDSDLHEYNIAPFDVSTDLITVTSTPTDGANEGYQFDGTGAAMTDGDVFSAGLIYAYNETGQLRLWHPTTPNCIIQVGPNMGESSNNQCARDVHVFTNVWKGINCTWYGIPNGVTTGTRRRIIYECNVGYAHISGDLQRYCQQDSTWNGTLPVCKKCESLDTGSSALIDTELLRTHNIAQFTCTAGYQLITGNLTRTCGLPNATWSGEPPVCEATTTSASTAIVTSSTALPTSSTALPTSSTVLPTSSTTRAPSTSISAPSVSQPSVVQICYNISTVIYNTSTFLEQTQQIVANLTVDAKTTSKYARSKVSAKDGRSSSMFIGLAGSIIFGVVCGFFLIPDFINILCYLFRSGERSSSQ